MQLLQLQCTSIQLVIYLWPWREISVTRSYFKSAVRHVRNATCMYACMRVCVYACTYVSSSIAYRWITVNLLLTAELILLHAVDCTHLHRPCRCPSASVTMHLRYRPLGMQCHAFVVRNAGQSQSKGSFTIYTHAKSVRKYGTFKVSSPKEAPV